MGIRDTIKAVVQVVTTRKLPNPLAQTPKDTSRAALVKELNDWWMNARKFWEPVFKEIEEDMIFAGGKQWPDGVLGADGSLPYQAFLTGPCAPWSGIVVDNVWHILTIWAVWKFLV